MVAPPLAIVQARMGSRRFPGKMLHPLCGKPLIWYAWRRSVEAFGEANVVVAMPDTEENDVLAEYIGQSLGGNVFRYDGDENDVLGRFFACAHSYRWHPDAVICRVTPDDPLKDPALMLAVAAGARHPVELSCEATTLLHLTLLHQGVVDLIQREHLTEILSPVPPPAPPEGVWTIDTPEDLEAVEAKMKGGV